MTSCKPEYTWSPPTASQPAAEHSSNDASARAARGLAEQARFGQLTGLLQALGHKTALAALKCAADLAGALLQKHDRIANSRVLVMYGGGKDSTAVVAIMRAVQLLTRETLGETFTLRVATYRHNGMPRAVMENINRVYTRLALFDDPLAELLIIDGDTVRPFAADLERPAATRDANRIAMLMNAHRSGGDGRSTFCDMCNLEMTRSFRLAAAFGLPVDMIVTGDSPAEQRRYAVWVQRASTKFAPDATRRNDVGIEATLDRLERLHAFYVADVQGPRSVPAPLPASQRPLEFFSIFGYESYDLASHRELVEDVLGFSFDEPAFAFSESDCANPYLMALMRGLTHERVRKLPFEEGIREYLEFALELMRRKRFPEDLVERMAVRFSGQSGAAALRALAVSYLAEAFDTSESQLVAALFSPFTDGGANLLTWVDEEAPQLRECAGAIRMLASGEMETDGDVETALRAATGLDVDHVRQLWRSRRTPNLSDPASAGSPLAFVRRHDPHKSAIRSRQTDGIYREETISGR